MKKKNVIINSLFVAISYIVKFALAFLVKSFLIKTLGDEYNGVDALLTSIISILAIAELGIGVAINYNLYKPLKENNIEKIKSIIRFYKKCYYIIAAIVLVLGLALLPFVPMIIGEVEISDNLYILYSLFLFDSVVSYLLCFRQSIFVADQKNYIISIWTTIKIIAIQSCRILVLVLTKNYILYTIVSIVFNFLQNLVLYLISNKMYPYLKDKNVEKLDEETRNDIKTKVKGLLFHKIGGYIVLGTDSILIGRICDVKTAGFYSNYYLIVNCLEQILGQMIDVLIPSLGSQLIENDRAYNYELFKKINFLIFFLFAVLSTCYFIVVQDFVIIWLGADRLLTLFTTFCISLNFFLFGMRKPVAVFENAAGIFYENRFVPLIESVTNIVASILLGLWIGLPGIIIGTTISSLWIFLFSNPKYVWRRVFDVKLRVYFFTILLVVFEFGICIASSYFFVNWVYGFISIAGVWGFIIKGFISFAFACLVLLIINVWNPELKFFINRIKTFVKSKIFRQKVSG